MLHLMCYLIYEERRNIMNGNKLKTLRENNGMLQKQLADYLEISPSTIGMYEQERREPDNNILKKIDNFFGVSTDYLLDNDITNNKNETIVREKETLKKALITTGYMKEEEELSDEKLKRLMKFIKIIKIL